MEVPSQLVKSEVNVNPGTDDKEVFNKTGKGNNRYYSNLVFLGNAFQSNF